MVMYSQLYFWRIVFFVIIICNIFAHCVYLERGFFCGVPCVWYCKYLNTNTTHIQTLSYSKHYCEQTYAKLMNIFIYKFHAFHQFLCATSTTECLYIVNSTVNTSYAIPIITIIFNYNNKNRRFTLFLICKCCIILSKMLSLR